MDGVDSCYETVNLEPQEVFIGCLGYGIFSYTLKNKHHKQ